MPDKDQVATYLAHAHRQIDPSINRVVRLLSDQESDAREPLKLLEVNPDTSPSGVVPIAWQATPPLVPYTTVVVEVTEDEFDQIQRGLLPLPDGWQLGDTLYPAA